MFDYGIRKPAFNTPTPSPPTHCLGLSKLTEVNLLFLGSHTDLSLTIKKVKMSTRKTTTGTTLIRHQKQLGPAPPSKATISFKGGSTANLRRHLKTRASNY